MEMDKTNTLSDFFLRFLKKGQLVVFCFNVLLIIQKDHEILLFSKTIDCWGKPLESFFRLVSACR